MNKEKLLSELNATLSIQWELPIPLDNIKLPTFNTSIFPNWLKDYVEAVAEETQTPVDAAAMACLTTLSTILGGKFVVKPNGTSWTETLSLYCVLALDPANRKSAVFRLFQEPLTKFEKEERERLIPLIEEKQAEEKAIKRRIIELENKYSNECNKEKTKLILDEIKELQKKLQQNEKIIFPRFFTNDVTPEKLAELMFENNGRFAILSSEGAELFDMVSGRYSEKYNLDIYLKAHSGDNITIDRKNSNSIFIPNPTLTIGLFVQPTVIQNLPRKFSERGLTQRFLFFLPQSFIGFRKIKPIPIPTQTKKIYEINIRKLITFEHQKQKKEPIQLVFDEGATNYLIDIQTEVEKMLGNQDMDFGFRGWLGKLIGQIVRIAGVLHIAENIQNEKIPNKITRKTLKRADLLRDYFIKHAEKAFGLIGKRENYDDLKYLLDKITSKKFEREEYIAYQELWQLVKKRFKKSEECKKYLNILEELNYIKNSFEGRKQIIYVNPHLQNNYPISPNILPIQLHQQQ
ncbi:YfjI family protein [Calidifontibacillus erzurumensis]|uniref:DUF3987 domain-containing protein n=1 Tax=Calidifontibacillus erzurumensis TaxID=2741433 RepID=A0A8J8GG45_9BACI|nr:YfjI family protein [Calidifontibacillus erzurumensis]NSL53295.1 DUF3987 domain-containing protein [Calidifontibacillus erzurumensis]